MQLVAVRRAVTDPGPESKRRVNNNLERIHRGTNGPSNGTEMVLPVVEHHE
jgi:hypothetical protein